MDCIARNLIDCSVVKLVHYRAQSVTVNRRRVYDVGGYRYPGVTTVLSATKPAEARAALQRWRSRVGPAEAQRISGQASSVGTRLHRCIAATLRGEPVTVPQDLADYWASMQPTLNAVEEAWLVEGAVWHRAGFVGFPDALVVTGGRLCLWDWKTARQPKRIEWITDYFLQTAAYWKAIEQVYADQGVQIDEARIAIALADQPAQQFTLELDALTDVWEHFQRRLWAYHARYHP